MSGSVRYAPGVDGRGFSVRLGSAWGADSGGAERLWAKGQSGFSGGFASEAHLEGEAGYAFDAGPGLLTPLAGVALSSGSRTWRAGARWTPGSTFDVGLEASFTDYAGEEKPKMGLILRGSTR